jgi:hypothetical protein
VIGRLQPLSFYSKREKGLSIEDEDRRKPIHTALTSRIFVKASKINATPDERPKNSDQPIKVEDPESCFRQGCTPRTQSPCFKKTENSEPIIIYLGQYFGHSRKFTHNEHFAMAWTDANLLDIFVFQPENRWRHPFFLPVSWTWAPLSPP